MRDQRDVMNALEEHDVRSIEEGGETTCAAEFIRNRPDDRVNT